jgi:hypothetical protein
VQRVHRTDFASEAAAIEPTPQGGVRVRARIARVGVLRYSDGAGRTWGEYRPPEEVFAEDSLTTLRGATVTDLHPQGLVTAESYRTLARGHAHDDVGAEADRYVVATLAVNDASLARMVLDGERRDVSAGYTCEVEPTPGVSPEGEPYDGIQRRIRFNHVALGPRGWGRSGTDVGLRMDGAAFEVSADGSAAVMETKSMKRTLKVRGVEYRLDGDNPEDDKAQKAISDMEMEAEKMPKKDADNAALLAQLEAAQKALTEAVGEVAKLKAQMSAEQPAPVVTEEMVPEEVMDAALARREQLRADAAVILGDEAVKALKPAELKRAALAKLSVKADGLDAKLVDSIFTGAVAAAKATKPAERRNDSLDALNRVGNAPPSEHADSDPIDHMEKTTAARWQQPLMHSAAKGA